MVLIRPLFSTSSSLFPSLSTLLLARQLQVISLLTSCTTTFFVLRQGLSTCLTFCFLWISLCSLPIWQILFSLLLNMSMSSLLSRIRQSVCVTNYQRCFIIIIITHESFSHQRKLMVFHWRLSDSKSHQVSRTLLSILPVFNNAVVWKVSTRPPTSKSSRPFNNPLVTVPKAPVTIGIIVTFMFHSFFNSLVRSRYLSFFSHSFSFIQRSAGTAKSTILQILFFIVDYYKVWSSGWD